MLHSKTVTQKGNKMTTYYTRGRMIWISYYVDGVRFQKSTKLLNTPQNIKVVKNDIIPPLDIKIATGEIYKKKPKTFGYYGSIFLKHKSKLKSYVSKSSKWNRVIEFFENRDIDTITRLELKQYLISLDMKSISKGAYKNCINEIFELAVDDGAVRFNPSLDIRLTREEKKQVEYYTKEEAKRLINEAEGIFKVYLQIAFNTGLRSGEILGLQIGDFEEKFINVRRTRTKGVIGSGKTWNAKRKVPYPSFLLDQVKSIQSNNIFIFGNIDDSGKLDYLWRSVTKSAEVRRLRLYCTRHTFATLMLQDKIVSINELAGLLGHSSAKTTLDKYASVIESQNVEISSDFSLICDDSVTMGKREESKPRKIGTYSD